ncbi:nucleoside monophosphate kinase [Kitasatospora sp. NPDC048545]|uniref:nucleoside monophosphate kinase n=1 Tax=Kitasatospora sp. NPDC048545 TaxID=3157208 RepID=UPI0033BFDD10
MRIVNVEPPAWLWDTPGRSLARALAVPRINFGDLLRRHLREGTELGRRAAETMESGGLPPDELMTAVVRDHLRREAPAAFLLDHHPLNAAGLLRWLPVRGRTDGLTAAGFAGVRGGSKAALVVAVVEPHLAGVTRHRPAGPPAAGGARPPRAGGDTPAPGRADSARPGPVPGRRRDHSARAAGPRGDPRRPGPARPALRPGPAGDVEPAGRGHQRHGCARRHAGGPVGGPARGRALAGAALRAGPHPGRAPAAARAARPAPPAPGGVVRCHGVGGRGGGTADRAVRPPRAAPAAAGLRRPGRAARRPGGAGERARTGGGPYEGSGAATAYSGDL